MALKIPSHLRIKLGAVAAISLFMIAALVIAPPGVKKDSVGELDQIARLVKRGELEKASEQSRREIERASQRFGADSKEMTLALYQHARILTAQGRTGESFDLWQRAVATEIRVRGSETILVAEGLISIGELEVLTKRQERALGFTQRALKILDASSGQRAASERSRALTLLAEIQLDNKGCEEAVDSAEQGLQFVRREKKDLKDLELRLNAVMGKSLSCLGRFDEAADYFKTAVSIARRRKDKALAPLLIMQGENLCQLDRCKHGDKLIEQGMRLAQEEQHQDTNHTLELVDYTDRERNLGDSDSRAQLSRDRVSIRAEDGEHFESF